MQNTVIAQVAKLIGLEFERLKVTSPEHPELAHAGDAPISLRAIRELLCALPLDVC